MQKNRRRKSHAWAPLRLAQLQTPRLAARVAAADCQAHAQGVLPPPSESCF
jgi:hypothetical protein